MISNKLVNATNVLRSEFVSLVRREKDFYLVKPRTAILILTYRCDSKCKTCVMWKKDPDKEMSAEIDLNSWKSIIDKLCDEDIRTFELFGGNVLLRKGVLVPILEYLHEKEAIIHMPTNQLGLDDDIAEALVRYVDTVYLSTDGIGDKHDEIRGVEGSLCINGETVERLIQLRNNISRGRGRLRIVCNCTVSRFNVDNLYKIAEYAERKSYDELHFEYAGEFDSEVVKKSKIKDIVPDPHYIRQSESILVSKLEALRIKKSLADISREYRDRSLKITTINIDSMSVKNLYKGTIPHRKCYLERNEISVDPYGNLVACPFITNYKMGNILKSRFKDIWNNNSHKVFREAQNSGALPMCRNCILGVQWNHGIVKSVHRIYLSRLKPHLKFWT